MGDDRQHKGKGGVLTVEVVALEEKAQALRRFWAV